jgi:hypothetical protein
LGNVANERTGDDTGRGELTRKMMTMTSGVPT